MSTTFRDLASYYDLMYYDEAAYRKKTEHVRALAHKYGIADGGRLLELGCATGMHGCYLSKYYKVSGFDMNETMVKAARKNVPNGEFFIKELLDFQFDYDERFDLIVNFYGGISFAHDWEILRKTLEGSWDNLNKGGLLIFTPWGMKETFKEHMFVKSEQKGEISLCRMESMRRVSEHIAETELHHLVAKGLNAKHYHYKQQFSIWSKAEYRRAIESSGFTQAEYLDEEEFPMGAFVCIKEG